MAASTRKLKNRLLKTEQGACFAAFYPGAPSFLDVLTWLKWKKPELFIRGTVSSAQALPRPPRKPGTGTPRPRPSKAKTGETGVAAAATTADVTPVVPAIDATAPNTPPVVTAPVPEKAPAVALLSETKTPGRCRSRADFAPAATKLADTATAVAVPVAAEKTTTVPVAAGDSQNGAAPAPAKPPRRRRIPTIIAASALELGWQDWHKELLKLPDAHAIVHTKVVVVDPFGADPTVAGAASDNLGLKAAVCNDETMVIVRGNRPLAIAYFVHCMDIFRHFQWRYLVSTGQAEFTGELLDTTAWQKKFTTGKTHKEYAAMVDGSELLPKKA